MLALVSLTAADGFDAARGPWTRSSRRRARGAALTVVTISAASAHRAAPRNLAAAQADAQAAIELAPDLLGAEFLVLAVSSAVLAGLERDETPDPCAGSSTTPAFGTTPSSCRAPSCATPPACFAPRPATTKPRSRSCAAATTRCSAARTRPCPAWRSAAALLWPSSTATTRLALGRRRGAPRAVVRRVARDRHRAARPGLAGTPAERPKRLAEALAVLAPAPARWSMRVCWSTSAQRSAPPGSGPRPGSLCSKRSRRSAAAPERWSAGRGPSSRRSASGPEPPTAPVRTR